MSNNVLQKICHVNSLNEVEKMFWEGTNLRAKEMLLHCRRACLGTWTGHNTQLFRFKSALESGKLNIKPLTKCGLEGSSCLA